MPPYHKHNKVYREENGRETNRQVETAGQTGRETDRQVERHPKQTEKQKDR